MEKKQTMPAFDSRFYQFHAFALLALISLLYSLLALVHLLRHRATAKTVEMSS